MFMCGSFMQEDSIEHYSGCRVCVAFLGKHLHYLEPVTKGHLVVLGTCVGMGRDKDLVRLALWAYTLYKTFNHLRNRSGVELSAVELEGLMLSFLHDGVVGHPEASRYLDHCWDPHARLRPGQEDSSDSSWGLGDPP